MKDASKLQIGRKTSYLSSGNLQKFVLKLLQATEQCYSHPVSLEPIMMVTITDSNNLIYLLNSFTLRKIFIYLISFGPHDDSLRISGKCFTISHFNKE